VSTKTASSVRPSVLIRQFDRGQIRIKFYFGEFVSDFNFHLALLIVTTTLHEDFSGVPTSTPWGGIINVYQIEKRHKEMPHR
jgi:hypothetical protein